MKTELCGKMIQRGMMSEPRPCIRRKGTCRGQRNHTPDLTGLKFGELIVLRKAEPYIRPGDGHKLTRWVCERRGQEHSIITAVLVSGLSTGCRTFRKGYVQTHRPIYDTVRNHWRWITNSQDPNHAKYKNMPFCDDWNPDKGGRIENGIKWILDNLGDKPSKGRSWSLDVIEHELGFVPGNLRWANHRTQRENQRYRKLGHCSLQEIEVEARRRGYILTPLLNEPNGDIDLPRNSSFESPAYGCTT